MSRNQDCKNILIIGFGKIGKIKAYKWLSRGYEVYVKDLKFSSMKYLNTNSDVLDDLSRQYFTIEICTPTNHHLMLLKTVITRYVYSYISIEKPLCNRLEDLEEMKSLVGSHPHLAKKMFASEQYFFSKILEKLLQVDCFSLDKIKEITVNFSKDRIEDNENGRFLDKEILGYGIEIPHIIAVISYLGISLEEFKKGIFVNAIYIKDLEKHDYSIEILSCINQTVIKIISNLGSFAIREGKIEGGDAKTVRRVTIDDKTMFVIGIPTLNEADNISRLVKQIDEYAVNLGKEIIINSDSKSTDGTPQIFLETKTYNTKVSIVSEAKGKGYNVRNIFEYAINHVPNFSGLILIDGDVVSMKKMWLEKMFIAIESGNDLIIPNYARKSFEGNATNHFIYPMLVKFFKRDMPYQCISGDFGFSRGLIKDLTLKCNWHKYTLGYGIDIFLTLTAILKSYKIKEIDLQSKIHKKSFEKIEKIFLEVSQSFFETINDNSLNQDKLRLNINFESHSRQFIKSSDILSSNDIENLKLRALFLLQEEKQYPHGLSEVEWDGILSNTINNIYRYSSEEHSLYLLPLYLLRVYNYLKYN